MPKKFALIRGNRYSEYSQQRLLPESIGFNSELSEKFKRRDLSGVDYATSRRQLGKLKNFNDYGCTVWQGFSIRHGKGNGAESGARNC